SKLLASTQEDLMAEKDRLSTEERERVAKELADAAVREKEADARIAEAQRGAAEANARATKAQESLALAEQHSAEANTKAEGFRADIAKANKSAAQARAQVAGATAEAAKANLELARLKTPRTLSIEQQQRIVGKIKPFAGKTFDLFVATDPDSVAL